MRYVCILSLVCSLGLWSCHSGNSQTGGDKNLNKEATAANLPQSKLNDAGTQMLLALVNHYYTMKNALVVTNAAQADSAASQMIPIADSLTASLQKDNANQSLQPYIDTIKTQSMALVSLKDESCEQKRAPFAIISSALFGLLKNVELKNANVYRDYCPMAFNEKGAYWLSNENEIKNPYVGKKMMDCGEITDSLK